MDKVRLGIVGVGGVARGHMMQLEKCANAKIVAMCDIDADVLRIMAEKYGVPEDHCFTDYHDLVKCPDVDAVEICMPNYAHMDCAIAAVKAGKAIEVEKPLALNHEEAEPLVALLEQSGLPNMVCFSYRFSPAAQYAKSLIQKGSLGEIVSVSVEYLKDSAFTPGRKFDWRFDKTLAGAGVLADLGAHLIDLTRYMVGEFAEVNAEVATMIKQRPMPDYGPLMSGYWKAFGPPPARTPVPNAGEMMQVTTDDFCQFLARIGKNGDIPANFTISRCCAGEKNHVKFIVYGTNGLISFDENDREHLTVCIGKEEMNGIGAHVVDVPAEFFYSQEQAFVDLVQGITPAHLPDLAPSVVKDGLANQKIIDAVLLSSQERRWINIG